MKKTVIALSAALVLGTLIGCVAYAQQNRHPEMHAAIQHLNMAENSLQHAAHDYGGHRERAMALIQQARDEIKAGIEYANHH